MLFPKVNRLKDRLILLSSKIGYNLVVTCEYRSVEEQNRLYAQGRTTPGNIVTNAKGGESLHNYAVAFDIAINQNGKYNYDIPAFIGWLGNYIGLEWGGGWFSFKDKPHFQYMAGYSLQDFQNGRVDINRFI